MCGFTSTFPLQTWGTFTLLEGVCSHTPNFYSTTLVLPSNQTLIILLNPSTIERMVPKEGGATRQAELIEQCMRGHKLP